MAAGPYVTHVIVARPTVMIMADIDAELAEQT
jgi:hypothetical protein